MSAIDAEDDDEAEDEDSEAALIRKFQSEQQDKLWLSDKIRDRQQRLIRVEQKIREFDVDNLQQDQMDELNNIMGSVNTQWTTLKSSLEQKFNFCRQIHDQHNLEVENYAEFGDLFDQKKFKSRVERSISKLQSEQALQKMSLQQLQSEKEKLLIYKKRLATDLIELKTENTNLKEQRMEEDPDDEESRGSVSAQSERDDTNEVNSQLRESISKMKARMQKLETMSINVAADPAKAIQQIADPILKLIEAKTDHQEKVLQDMQMERLRKQKRILELKEQIFNEKFEHINLRRTIEEQEVEKINVQEDKVFVQKQLKE